MLWEVQAGPQVSVLIPTFNMRGTLLRALASLRLQRFEDFEAIVVDDGSTDGSAALVERCAASWGDRRLRCVRLPRNLGRGSARAAALAEARGEFCAFLDADDWLLPHKLEAQVALLRAEPACALVDTGFAVVLGSATSNTGAHRPGAPDAYAARVLGVATLNAAGPEFFRHVRVSAMPVRSPTALLRRERAVEVGFDARLRRGEDFDFITRYLLGQTYARLPALGYVYQADSRMQLRTYGASSLAGTYAALKHLRRQPYSACVEVGRRLAKLPAYAGLFALGQQARLASHGLRPATDAELATISSAESAIAATSAQLG